MGAFYSNEDATYCAKLMSEEYGQRHWAMEIPTYPHVGPAPEPSRQLEFPAELMRHRGQSDWGIDLALETARRWS